MTYTPLPQDAQGNVSVNTDVSAIARESGGNLDLISQLVGILTQLQAGPGRADGNTLRTVTATDSPEVSSAAVANAFLASIAGQLPALRPIPSVPADTSPLAQETGGNLDAIAQALAILTQIDVGSGAVGSNTLRVAVARERLLSVEYEFGAGAVTNARLLSAPIGTRIAVVQADCTVSRACTVNVGARIGFEATPGAAALSTIGSAADSPTPAQMILSHPKFAPGSGIVKGNGITPFVVGDSGCSVYLTADASTNGKIRCMLHYYLTN